MYSRSPKTFHGKGDREEELRDDEAWWSLPKFPSVESYVHRVPVAIVVDAHVQCCSSHTMTTRRSARQLAKANASQGRYPNQTSMDNELETKHPPGWHRPGDRKEERKWVEELVSHLHTDPIAQDNNATLRFLLMEWRDMKGNLHRIEGLEKVKTRLLALGVVRFLRKNDVTGHYEYWRDHSSTGQLALLSSQEIPGAVVADQLTDNVDDIDQLQKAPRPDKQNDKSQHDPHIRRPLLLTMSKNGYFLVVRK